MALLGRVVKGAVRSGSFSEVAEVFDITPKTASNLWYSTLKMIPDLQMNAPLDPCAIVRTLKDEYFATKFQNAGRKRLYDPELVMKEIQKIPIHKRRSIRSVAGTMGIPRATIGRLIQEKKIRAHTLSLKPKLTDDHLCARLYHCLWKIDPSTLNNNVAGTVAGLKYMNMYNDFGDIFNHIIIILGSAEYMTLQAYLEPIVRGTKVGFIGTVTSRNSISNSSKHDSYSIRI